MIRPDLYPVLERLAVWPSVDGRWHQRIRLRDRLALGQRRHNQSVAGGFGCSANQDRHLP
jgi:hypothetical protein